MSAAVVEGTAPPDAVAAQCGHLTTKPNEREGTAEAVPAVDGDNAALPNNSCPTGPQHSAATTASA